MARNDRTVRLETLKAALCASRAGVTVKQLVARHGWKDRAIYRDLDVLEQSGYALINERGRFRLEGKPSSLAGLPDADERLALFLAREQSRGWGATSLGKALDRLWHRISTSAGGQASLVPVDSVPWLTAREWTPTEHVRYRQVIATLEKGVRERRLLRIEYRALSTGVVTQREVEPGQLHWDQRLGTLYLIAWCRLRGAVRVFAAHRIQDAVARDEACLPRAGTRSAAALRNAFRVWCDEYIATVEIQFTGRAASEIRERVWLAEQRVSESRGGLVLQGRVAGLAEVERWILSYGPEARALAPAELVERVAAKLLLAGEAYARVGGSAKAKQADMRPGRGTAKRVQRVVG